MADGCEVNSPACSEKAMDVWRIDSFGAVVKLMMSLIFAQCFLFWNIIRLEPYCVRDSFHIIFSIRSGKVAVET